VQRQVAANQASDLIAIIKALDRLEGSEYKESAEQNKNDKQAKRQRAG
jgi:hypothetical protein